MKSELFGYTIRVFIGNIIARLALPILLLKYKEFWGLRQATLKSQGRRVIGKLMEKCYYVYVARYGAEIPLTVKFDGPPCLPHGLYGIFISGFAHIGRNVTILQQVTIGQDTFSTSDENSRMYVKDNVFIGAGAKIIGGIVIGENCRIGANCCVYSDMQPNFVAVSQPTRFIEKNNLVNYFRQGKRIFKDGGWVVADI